MALFPHLFSEVKIADVQLRNRIVMPAMATNATVDGTVSPAIINYFSERAEGGCGLVITEAAAIAAPPEGKLARYHLNLSDDSYIPSLRRLTDAIHRFDTKIAVQLSHLGRQIHADFLGAQPLAPSPIPCPVCRDVPKELSTEEITNIVEEFIRAALRAYRAGFDMVELHGCHGYLISQFFSGRSNHRKDQYGGNSTGRSRMCREIIRGIKHKLGGSFPVIVRMNGHDFIKEGATLDDMRAIAPLLVKAGADALHISAGVYGSYKATVGPMYEHSGCFVDLAAGIREVVSVPVIAVGRITHPSLANAIIRDGKADLIAMGRALLADPALPRKARQGLIDDIRPCLGCNQGCIDRINDSMMAGRTQRVTCMVNPRVLREAETRLTPAPRAKDILVLGGGPAGMQAALTAAQRGHRVTLWEKTDRLGGQFNLAARPPGRELFAAYIVYMEHMLERAGVMIQCHRTATPEAVRACNPDGVIFALGSWPIIPAFVNHDVASIFTAWEVLHGYEPAGERIAVIGGGAVGLETAHYLVTCGKTVTILEATNILGGDMGAIVSFYLRGFLKKHGVVTLKNTEVRNITDTQIRVRHEGREATLTDFDAVVIALGTRPTTTGADEFRHLVPDFYIIGDAAAPGKALDAIAQAFDIGRTI